MAKEIKNTTATKTTKAKTTKAAKKVEVKEVPVEEKRVVKAAAPKKFDSEDLILCRSVTQGELLYQSKKTGILYIWAGYGDEVEVQYQDLLPLYLTRSSFLFNPYFVVENEDLIQQWGNLQDLYKDLFKYEDLDYVLNLNSNEFQMALLSMPAGFRESLKTMIATRIDEGSFDSLQKIKLVDEILGTDLRCLIN